MKRIRKNRVLTYSLLGVFALSLVGVGFAAWTFTGFVGDEALVNVTVGDVIDKVLVVKVDEVTDGSVSFDNLASGTTDVKNDPNGGTEDLSFAIKYTLTSTVSLFDEKTGKGKFIIDIAFADGTIKAYKDKFDNEDKQFIDTSCLNGFSFETKSGDSIDSDPNVVSTIAYSENNTVVTVTGTNVVSTIEYKENNTVATVTSTFSFKWGSYFGGNNPAQSKTGDVADDVFTISRKLHEFLDAKPETLPDIELTITPHTKEQVNNE